MSLSIVWGAILGCDKTNSLGLISWYSVVHRFRWGGINIGTQMTTNVSFQIVRGRETVLRHNHFEIS
jgi:hypothetical protein